MLTHGCEPFIKRIEQAVEHSVSLAQHRKMAGIDAPPADFRPKIMVAQKVVKHGSF
jgi:hypothetical protein